MSGYLTGQSLDWSGGVARIRYSFPVTPSEFYLTRYGSIAAHLKSISATASSDSFASATVPLSRRATTVLDTPRFFTTYKFAAKGDQDSFGRGAGQSLDTSPAPKSATQILAPSNANPFGPTPTGNVPKFIPSLARSLVTSLSL